jgi:RNA polymerase sigma-70 factor (ECF subfamily)
MTRPPEDLDLDEIAGRFRPVIGFKVRRALGWRCPDWEDVTNEVLAQAIAKIRGGEFRGDSSIGTYIYTITCRRIVDYIRDKAKTPCPFPSGTDAPLISDRFAEEERLAELTAAVIQLPPKYREVLDLYYYRELSREETARRIGLTPPQVSERVHYAQKLLRKILRRAGFPFLPGSDD